MKQVSRAKALFLPI